MTSSKRSKLDLDGDGKVGDDVARVSGWVIAAGVILVLAVTLFASYIRTKTHTTLVTGKERVCDDNADGGTDCKYLVYTERGTYELTDSLLAMRFNSSDLYGQIKVCHRYKIDGYGWRFGPTSMYPNIKDVEDLGRVDGCEP